MLIKRCFTPQMVCGNDEPMQLTDASCAPSLKHGSTFKTGIRHRLTALLPGNATISTQFFSIEGMLNNTNHRTVSTLIRWTEEEWRTIAHHICVQQSEEPMHELDLQKIKARDVFVAQEVLPEDRHRKLASIAQGFAAIRARLDALTRMVPEGEQVTAWAEKTEVGSERCTIPDTAPRVAPASEEDIEASDQISGRNGLAADQTSERDVMLESQGSRAMHLASGGSDRAQQHVHMPCLMEAMRPFLVMVCEEIANALTKVIARQRLRDTLPAASRQARSGIVSSRQEALQSPVVEEGLPRPSPAETTHEHRLSDEAKVKSVDIDFASHEEYEECDELEVQPLFDPKLPPSANSDFKPKIGLVSTPGSDFEGLRQRYPQLHLTIVQADALSDVRRFGHCQRIIALREDISADTDALLSRLLRHRYIRLEGGMNGVTAQFDAWLASPGSIATGFRRSVPFSGMERYAASGRKYKNRYPKRISNAG